MVGYGNSPSTNMTHNESTKNTVDDLPDSFYGGSIQKYPSDLYQTNHLVASVNQKLNVLIILKIICIIMGGVGLVFFYKYFMSKSGKK